jgi:hypothetical protein
MSFKQAMLMTVVIFFSVIWLVMWNGSISSYPPLNEMITLKGEISYFYPRRGKTTGTITIKTKEKEITLSSWIGEETGDKYGNFVGLQAIVMIRPSSTYSHDYNPRLEHLELTDGDVIIDYQARREEHLEFLEGYDRIDITLKIIISIFSLLFIFSFRKSKKI